MSRLTRPVPIVVVAAGGGGSRRSVLVVGEMSSSSSPSPSGDGGGRRERDWKEWGRGGGHSTEDGGKTITSGDVLLLLFSPLDTCVLSLFLRGLLSLQVFGLCTRKGGRRRRLSTIR